MTFAELTARDAVRSDGREQTSAVEAVFLDLSFVLFCFDGLA